MPSNFDAPRLDGPDLNTRAIMLRRQQGQQMNRADSMRLADRMSVEDQTRSQNGGIVNGGLPRQPDASASYAAGRGSVIPRMLPIAPAATATASSQPPRVPLTPTPPPSAPNVTPRGNKLNIGESAVIGENPMSGGNPALPLQRALGQPSAIAGLEQQGRLSYRSPDGTNFDASSGGSFAPAAPVAPTSRATPIAPPVTPPARGALSPTTPTATVGQGGTADISARAPAMPTADASKAQNFGGQGAYRQQFSTAESAQIYDNYVRSLFAGGGGPEDRANPATGVTLQRTNPAPSAKPTIDWGQKSGHEVLQGIVGRSPSLGALKEGGRRIFDAITPNNDMLGNPVRRLSVHNQKTQREGNPRQQKLAASGSP
jgi:hypothetical protein